MNSQTGSQTSWPFAFYNGVYLVILLSGILLLLAATGARWSGERGELPTSDSGEELHLLVAAQRQQVDEHVDAAETLLHGLQELVASPFDPLVIERLLRVLTDRETQTRITDELEPMAGLPDLMALATAALAQTPEQIRQEVLGEQGATATTSRLALDEAFNSALEQIAQLKERLATLRAEYRQAETLAQIAQVRRGELEAHAELNQAWLVFADGRYTDCLAMLETGGWRGSLIAEARLLQQRAEFRVQADKVLEKLQNAPPSDNAPELGTLRSLLSELLRREPPDEQDQTLYNELVLAQQTIKANQRAAQLESLPIRARLEEANAIRQAFPGVRLEPDWGSRVRAWLREGIPEKVIKDLDPALREAEYENGELLLGVFEDGGTHYKHWKPGQEILPHNYGPTVPKDRLKRHPGPLTIERCARAYTTERNHLFRSLEVVEGWEEFVVHIRSQQRELENYIDRGGDAMGLTFQDALDFAEDAVSVWPEWVQPLLD